jgi:hypothetical protein
MDGEQTPALIVGCLLHDYPHAQGHVGDMQLVVASVDVRAWQMLDGFFSRHGNAIQVITEHLLYPKNRRQEFLKLL